MHRLIRSVALSALLVLGLSACAAEGEQGAGAGAALTVVATTTQLTDFTRQVGGDRVEVTGLLKPNVDAHDFDPSPSDLNAIAGADAVVLNGVELEGSWLEDAIRSSGFDGPQVDTSADVELRKGEAHSEEEGAHSEEGHDHGAEGHSDEDGHNHGDEATATPAADDGHNHGEFDPHIWHNPRNAVLMVRSIETALAKADADGAETYRQNADTYVAELEALDAEVEADLAALENRKLVTNHEALGYYTDRYELDFVGSIIPSFDTSAELSAQEIDTLVQKIREVGVKAVFSETSLPPQTAETVGREAGVKVVTGDDALYGDSLGPEGSDAETYVGMIRHNTESIVANLS